MVAELLASPAADLLTGANLPFVASFIMAVLFTLLSVFGLGQSESDAEVDADADADLDHDIDLDHDVDIDHDVDMEVDHDLEVDVDHDVEVGVDHDVETGAGLEHDLDVAHDVGIEHDVETDLEHDHEVETDAGHGSAGHAGITLGDVLYFFGIGKVPLSILLMTFGYTFGLTGWLVNTFVAGSGKDVSSWFTFSLGAALVIGLAAMRLVSSTIAKIMPTKNVSGFRRRQLVGMRGVVGLPVSEQSGRAQITDPEGTRHQIRCRVVPGGAELAKGTNIIVVKYVAEDDLYYVAADRRR